MTYKERLQIEHPECIDEKEEDGCKGCPEDYGYCGKYSDDGRKMCDDWYDLECDQCWNEEIDEEKENMLKELEEFYKNVADIAGFLSKELKEHIEKNEFNKLYFLNDKELEEKYRLMISVRRALFKEN